MYKLIALDIDGTLLNSEKKITNEVFNSIQEAKKSGAKVVLSTVDHYLGLHLYLMN